MNITIWKKYKTMVLASIFFFYLGCGITLSLVRMDCVNADEVTKSYSKAEISLNNIEYAVLILSGPDNEIKRAAIRNTWCNYVNNIITENGEQLYVWNYNGTKPYRSNGGVKCFFVIGTHNLNLEKLSRLKIEESKNLDLLLLDNFEDNNYKTLASKMISALLWFDGNLKKLKYVIKCDDDSFVRIDLIIRDLDAYAPEMNAPALEKCISRKEIRQQYKGLYWGYFDGRAHVYFNGKWQERDWFLCDNYLPYALGGGYVISKSIVQYIARNADLLSQYNSEDVSMGVWTAALDGINRVHDIRFDTEWKSRGCNNNLLIRHKQSPKDMFEMSKTLVETNGEKMCKTDTEERKPYLYKWNKVPSKCC